MADSSLSKLGLGGGCHWCTEGVFASLIGVIAVNQGWISPVNDKNHFSEAIEVIFDPKLISQHDLINIHLHTHAASSNHAMRDKYRSALYAYNNEQYEQMSDSLLNLSLDFDSKLITQVFHFYEFKLNKAELQNYFYSAPNRPFCQTYIHPKLRLLLNKFTDHVDHKKLSKSGVDLLS